MTLQQLQQAIRRLAESDTTLEHFMAFITELKKDFSRLISANRLSHSYIFFGPAPEIQEQLARGLSAYLEVQEWDSGGKVIIDANFLDARLDSGIETAREMVIFLWQKPLRALRRTFVVVHAQNLTVPAQNAILKIAEEPPPHALIILLVNDPESLIQPLTSRFQKIYLTSERPAPREISEEARSLVRDFLKTSVPKEQTEIIKKVLENDSLFTDFVAQLTCYFREKPLKNWRVLKALMARWALINQFNVNKKLQLEVALLESNR